MTNQEARDDEREALIAEAGTRWPDEGWDAPYAGFCATARSAFVAGGQWMLDRKHPEPEWEYGVWSPSDWRQGTFPNDPHPDPETAAQYARYAPDNGDAMMRRTKALPAGPWVPVSDSGSGEGEQG